MKPESADITAVFALVLCAVCAAVGVVGIVAPADNSVSVSKEIEPTQVELIKVELSPADDADGALPAASAGAPGNNFNEKKTVGEFVPPAAPKLAEVAPPAKTVALATPEKILFAKPLDAPVLEETSGGQGAGVPGFTGDHGAPGDAAGVSVGENLGDVSGTPIGLVFGIGAGRQPAPEYPERARRMNWAGTVRVRFRVDAAGRVTEAAAAESSGYSSLDESALRAIRNRWRFPAGKPRFYEIEIHFKLN